MRALELIGILSTAYPAVKAFLLATKNSIRRHFREPDPYVDMAESFETPISKRQAEEDQDLIYYAAKSVLYGWSAYSIATNNPNPIEALVMCAAAIETAHDVYDAAQVVLNPVSVHPR